ncbi:hypothetical protein R6Q57_016221 [Mikania cordata]
MFPSTAELKGGASPAMFPSTEKKRSGGGFENQEPSSPKATCIGQVRIKSKKKHGKRLKNNQRRVHLPLTICEALRAFGSEFSYLFPCRASCFSLEAEREKVEKTGDRRSSGSGVAVFTRWLVMTVVEIVGEILNSWLKMKRTEILGFQEDVFDDLEYMVSVEGQMGGVGWKRQEDMRNAVTANITVETEVMVVGCGLVRVVKLAMVVVVEVAMSVLVVVTSEEVGTIT